MLIVGQQSCWPRIKFISNRLKIERVILEGLRRNGDHDRVENAALPAEGSLVAEPLANETWERANNGSNVLERKLTPERRPSLSSVGLRRQSSLVEEVRRQSAVFFDDVETEEATGMSTDEEDEAVADGKEHERVSKHPWRPEIKKHAE
jgi:hypothetical protein